MSTLLDDAALLSIEHQWHSSDVLGPHSWRMNLAEGVLRFDGAVPRTPTAVHFLGTAAPGPGSWLWAWDGPADGYASETLETARRLRDYGGRHDIALLTRAEVPFADVPGAPGSANLAAFAFIDVAKVVTGNWTGYTCELGGGARAAFLVEHPVFRLPPATPECVMRVLRTFVTEPPAGITDHRRALRSYAVRRGLGVSFNGSAAPERVTLPGLEVVIAFGADGAPSELTASVKCRSG
ncbi:DUF6882 domain-containing protein [Actinoplanes sp. NPDC051633]|uniref:DUF6882 domain-containing protein n=1 Tax=Actinoplanes sp. NPDC051633 TaxID=3155670 RepID=UPI003443445C